MSDTIPDSVQIHNFLKFRLVPISKQGNTILEAHSPQITSVSWHSVPPSSSRPLGMGLLSCNEAKGKFIHAVLELGK